MGVQSFKDLRVWAEAHQLVLTIYKVTKAFPTDEKFGLVCQVRRSSASVCANIVEGYKKTRKKFVRFLNIAHGSLEETKYHLILSKDFGYCSHDQYFELIQSTETVGKMLSGLIRKLR